MKLAIVVRTTDKGNSKARPEWFSKVACALSLKEAVGQLHTLVTVDVVADGGLPEGTEDVYGSFAQIRMMNAGNNRRSFHAALDVALERIAAGAEMIWFGEDDYIYSPESLQALVDAGACQPNAYVGLYTPDDSNWHAEHRSQPLVPPSDSLPFACGAHEWRSITHTTSSYGACAEVIRADHGLIRLVSYAGAPFAHSTSSFVQGVRPFSWRHLLADLNFDRSRASWGKAAARIVMRPVVNVVTPWVRRRNRGFIAPVEDLITHVESGHISPGMRWEEISRNMLERRKSS